MANPVPNHDDRPIVTLGIGREFFAVDAGGATKSSMFSPARPMGGLIGGA